ncbi:hypothetical protein CEXT_447081 [Caerostris extrusa]|uniref:Uncharacterized protein n=1 Tax=Caerostris extrusa TaxID=172846 RepID=A0AAV4Y5H3_CAEEX|nr:hypothetical protein CEXT_447081 [Caerostris extrusa]
MFRHPTCDNMRGSLNEVPKYTCPSKPQPRKCLERFNMVHHVELVHFSNDGQLEPRSFATREAGGTKRSLCCAHIVQPLSGKNLLEGHLGSWKECPKYLKAHHLINRNPSTPNLPSMFFASKKINGNVPFADIVQKKNVPLQALSLAPAVVCQHTTVPKK